MTFENLPLEIALHDLISSEGISKFTVDFINLLSQNRFYLFLGLSEYKSTRQTGFLWEFV